MKWRNQQPAPHFGKNRLLETRYFVEATGVASNSNGHSSESIIRSGTLTFQTTTKFAFCEDGPMQKCDHHRWHSIRKGSGHGSMEKTNGY
jgi:hypothetical protein